MRYLRGSIDYAIEYSGFPIVLEGYSDANWISNSNETKSTNFLNIRLVHIAFYTNFDALHFI